MQKVLTTGAVEYRQEQPAAATVNQSSQLEHDSHLYKIESRPYLHILETVDQI